MSKANTVCIDFDWTLCSNDKFGKPNPKMVELIKKLYAERYEILIYTSRKDRKLEQNNGVVVSYIRDNSISNWLKKYDLIKYICDVIYYKPEAVLYIDDRAYRYSASRLKTNCKDLPIDLIEKLIKYESDLLLKKETD